MSNTTRSYSWILFEHDLVHDLFKRLGNHEASFTSQVKEGEILGKEPGPIGSEEDVGLGGWCFLQGKLHRLDELCMLRVVEEKVGKDKYIECCCGAR